MNLYKLLAITFSLVTNLSLAKDVSNLTNSLTTVSPSKVNAHAGSINKFGECYFWYGEYRSGNNSDGVSVYRNCNFKGWSFLGLALQPADKTNSKLSGIIERPKVIFSKRLNKYIMYFHHELPGEGYSSALLGVADSQSPQGPFIYRSSFRINPGILPIGSDNLNDIKYGSRFIRDFNKGQMSRDITIFQDDDGHVYIVSVSEDNSTLLVSQLDNTLEKLDGKYARVSPGGYNEAPVLFKRNGKYYLITSGVTGWKPNESKLYISDNIFTGWKRVSTIVRSSKENIDYTFGGQPAFVFYFKGDIILSLDVWNEKNLGSSTYIFKTIQWDGDIPFVT